jgi:GTPase-activator protein for Ras-like GTPase
LIAANQHEYEHADVDHLGIAEDIHISPLDTTFGTVDLRLADLERGKDNEEWWEVCNEEDEVVGAVLMKVRVDETVVLMSPEYRAIDKLLHTFPTGLTQIISAACPNEIRRLPEILLNIFQVSGQVKEWLMYLIEDEIDNVHKETPVSRFRYSRRIASNNSFDSGVERELLLRDMGRTATVEANLLFRGNSLLTKTLDMHMRRLGKEYLEDVLGEKMRDIDESDPDCEVDPNRIANPEDLNRNWRNLITLTENVWKAIAASASRCPHELRSIFKYIRACAEDRYGDFLRTVAYSSVSGFLFLRFFCPAVLNPKLFGLLKGKFLSPPKKAKV